MVTALVALVGLASCSTTAPAGTAAPAAVPPKPLNVHDPAPSASATAPPSCDPRASLRQTGSPPQPGQMPAGSTMATIASHGRIVVGVDQNAYLLGYRDPSTGQLQGFDIDIAREIARAIFGSPDAIQFRAINAADRIPLIQNGSVDIVVRSFSITCARLQQVAFSTEYVNAPQRVLVNRGSGYNGIGDLGGKKVCAATGSVNIPVIQAAASHPVAVAADSVADCMVMLQQGQVDAISTDDTILDGMAAQDPDTVIVGGPLNDNPEGIAMAKSATDLVRFVNGVLDRIRTDGTWTAIYRRWLGPFGPVPAPPTPRYLD